MRCGMMLMALAACNSSTTAPTPTAPAEPPKPEEAPAPLAAPADAVRIAELTYKVLAEGTGGPAVEGERLAKLTFEMSAWGPSGLIVRESPEPESLIINPAQDQVSQVFAQMRRGAKWLVWVGEQEPSPFAFPAERQGPVLYRIELVNVTPGPVRPDEVEPPKTAKKEKGGWSWRQLEKGTGDHSPHPEQPADIELSAWSRDGALLFTTIWSEKDRIGRAEDAKPDMLKDVITKMVEGERRRVWVPAALSIDGVDTIIDVKLNAMEQGETVFYLHPNDHSRKLVVHGRQTSLFRKGTNVKDVPTLSPSKPPP